MNDENSQKALERERIAREYMESPRTGNRRGHSGMHIAEFLKAMRTESFNRGSGDWGDSPHVPTVQQLVEKTAKVMEVRKRARECQKAHGYIQKGNIISGSDGSHSNNGGAQSVDVRCTGASKVASAISHLDKFDSKAAQKSTGEETTSALQVKSKTKSDSQIAALSVLRQATAEERNDALRCILNTKGGFATAEGRGAIEIISRQGVKFSEIAQWTLLVQMNRSLAKADFTSKRVPKQPILDSSDDRSGVSDCTTESSEAEEPPNLIALFDEVCNDYVSTRGGKSAMHVSDFLQCANLLPTTGATTPEHSDYHLDPDMGGDY